ncbi:Phosphatidate cytidylyltransferase [Candidatus Trichorickettsia mobilis]|jgi:phosphatidate cytidylyltransferase|uniref:Phosphatidate cytidylyltransferase n=1 Tax=Candidatus Trichorickettsia mobilis TaxID=1346319 RepID=A0ABZ0UQU5_9RICK|nr:phosphatidate cytidylyltransferase [Candidatus Trichorickettsia mobilis]WPY00186.1 Phosphatidate cytidylyltransferase [Candidatus Trichorickettsia mobilis]
MPNFVLRIISSIVLVILFVASILWLPPLFCLCMILVASGMYYEWYKMTQDHIVHLLLGLVIISIPVITLILINSQPQHQWLLLGYFIMIWSVDTFAMIGGKILQGPKLAPFLSPKKTWSGLVVGVISSGIIVIAFDTIIDNKISHYYQLNRFYLMLNTGILAIIAQVSDLFISYFKRYHQIKDSGNIIPGHGGVLDRFDSIILTAPILFYTIYIL